MTTTLTFFRPIYIRTSYRHHSLCLGLDFATVRRRSGRMAISNASGLVRFSKSVRVLEAKTDREGKVFAVRVRFLVQRKFRTHFQEGYEAEIDHRHPAWAEASAAVSALLAKKDEPATNASASLAA